jgi:hypothetical protein
MHRTRSRRRLVVSTVALATGALLAAPDSLSAASELPATTAASAPTSTGCLQADPPAHPRPARLRFGVDPGPAGDLTPTTAPLPAYTMRRNLAAIDRLRPPRGPFVVRLNRLFWSGGASLLRTFTRRARRLSNSGNDVEVQVRYHPTSQEDGRIGKWTRWVRHVAATLGRIHHLVSLTITNEVNFSVSPNTSDGAYQKADVALVRGIEAAHRALRRRGWAHRVAVGFTYAYRFSPTGDADFFRTIGQLGGDRFRRALGFVGVDDYPGTVYPPALAPGDTAGHELAIAVATVRACYLPLAHIGRSTPIWVTENGFSSARPQHSDAKQRLQLRSMVNTLHRIAGSENVTDYRWFTLRDNSSTGTGTFDQDGLMTDHYQPKPSFVTFRRLIRRDTRRG